MQTKINDMDERYIAAVDLGTSKIALSVAKVEGNDVQIIYYDEEPSDGIRYSYVYNPAKVSVPLSRSLKKAEKELGIKILQVVVGLPRYFVRQEVATGAIPRTDVSSNITREEIDNLKNIALDNYPLPDADRDYIYGAVAQSFTTDDFYQIVEDDVEGMVSEKFEGNFKVFIGSRKNVSNLDKIFNEAGVAIANKYFVPGAMSKVVLFGEEMDNGVALVDLGGGVTSVSVYKNGILRHYAAIPFGGNSITADIKTEGGFSMRLAENIKLAFGACLPDKLANMSEKVLRILNNDSGSEKQLPVRYLSEIITARMEEIINAILYEIEQSGFADEIRSGIVITGGGAELTNVAALIKELSGYSVRVGYPIRKFSSDGCAGLGETSATGVLGMLLAAKDDNRMLNCLEAPPKPKVEENEPEAEEEEAAAEEETVPEDNVFNMEAWDKVKPPKKTARAPKPPRQPKQPKAPSPIWTKIGSVFEPLVKGLDDLYERIEE
jgi:cell division protein FtsA